jgi:ribonuclease I
MRFFIVHGYWPENAGDELPDRIEFTVRGIKTIVTAEWNTVGQEEVEISIQFTKEVLKAVFQYSSLLGKLRSLKRTS